MEYGETCIPGRMAGLFKILTVIDVKLFMVQSVATRIKSINQLSIFFSRIEKLIASFSPSFKFKVCQKFKISQPKLINCHLLNDFSLANFKFLTDFKFKTR
jgi:hypothetical protein